MSERFLRLDYDFPVCLSVLQRYYGNTQLRLPQNHHVEDEVINTSAVLSTSRHGCDRWYCLYFPPISSPLSFLLKKKES